MNVRAVIAEIVQVVLLALVAFFALHFIIQNFRIDGRSMEPNLHSGEYVIVNRTAYWFADGPQRGDVIVFQAPDQPKFDRIKRVIGLPGETVEVKRDGAVYVDGLLLEEEYLSLPLSGPSGTWTVPAGCYFVMGDNRPASLDSRYAGPVPRDYIIGKAWVIVWPIADWGGAPNYSVVLQAASP